MSILSKSSNATARHEIDSKLKTMRMRITENSDGGGGAASFYTFSKACYLHKDYIKLLEEIFPKPSAHSWQSFFLSISHKKPPLEILNRCGRALSFEWKIFASQFARRCLPLVYSLLFYSRYSSSLTLNFFFFISILTLDYLLKMFSNARTSRK